MYQLSERCQLLREMVTSNQPYETKYCFQREVYFQLGLAQALENGASNTKAVGNGLINVLKKFSPIIIPGEVIVGFNYGDLKYGDDFKPTNDESMIALLKENGITEEEIRQYFDVQNQTVPKTWPQFTREEEDAHREWAAVGSIITSNHVVIGYDKVLKLGYQGIKEEICRYEERNGTNELYQTMKAICDAACDMGKKYAEKAKSLMASGDERFHKEDLRRIIDICEKVPAHPAETLQEAIQSLWFAHIVNTWEDTINANSLGRLDQILYPYYQSDMERGTLTKEEAFELICLLWLKLYRQYDVQQSCVGGSAPDGSSQVNELSYMMLDATEQMNFVRCLSVRFSPSTDKYFLKRALEVVGHVQKGIPFFFNDDVMIPALISKGISPQDAYDYTQLGCVETVIPGKSNPHAVTGNVNVLKALEYVFCNGYSMMHEEMKNGIETGELEEFDTFEKFYHAVLVQMKHLLELSCSRVKKLREHAGFNAPKPYKSMLTEGCIETGKDFNDAGATYDYYQIMLSGVPNLADSLEAVRHYVFEKHRYTLAEMKSILVNDFCDESVRYEFINKVAKFGNDIDSVDDLASDLVDKACDYLEELSEQFGISYHPQPFTYFWMIDSGAQSAASPDGRHKGEILAYSVSPMQGRDFQGLTALLNSISKFPTKRTAGTTSAIVEIDPKLFSDRNIPALVDILVASAEKGLSNVQFNTIDAQTLMDAKQNPEKYNNLAVRVSGFSQKFNMLSPELQDHIIGRTKHTCL